MLLINMLLLCRVFMKKIQNWVESLIVEGTVSTVRDVLHAFSCRSGDIKGNTIPVRRGESVYKTYIPKNDKFPFRWLSYIRYNKFHYIHKCTQKTDQGIFVKLKICACSCPQGNLYVYFIKLPLAVAIL